jgi:hypothetical protein
MIFEKDKMCISESIKSEDGEQIQLFEYKCNDGGIIQLKGVVSFHIKTSKTEKICIKKVIRCISCPLLDFEENYESAYCSHPKVKNQYKIAGSLHSIILDDTIVKKCPLKEYSLKLCVD